MVEIGLEPMDGSAMPKDLYLSLRVGETQKFAKASATRTYKFSDSVIGDRKSAKLELYKRVGIASLSVEPQKFQGKHEITVNVQDHRIEDEQVRYHVNLASAPGLKAKEVKTGGKDKPEGVNVKVQAAKEYLERHQLEQRLSEAMQAVLRERPEDPGKFVAERLLSHAGMLKKVDPPPDDAAIVEPPPATPPVLPPAKPEDSKTAQPEESKPAPPPSCLEEPKATPAAEAPVPELVPTAAMAAATVPALAKACLGDAMVSPIMPMSVMVSEGMVTFASIGMGPVMIF